MSNPVELIPLEEARFRRARRLAGFYFPLSVPPPPPPPPVTPPTFDATDLTAFLSLGAPAGRPTRAVVDATAPNPPLSGGYATAANGSPTPVSDPTANTAVCRLIDSCLAAGYTLAAPPKGDTPWTLRFWYLPQSPDISGTNIATLACSDYAFTGQRQWYVRAFTSGGNQYVELGVWDDTPTLHTASVNLGPTGITFGNWMLVTATYHDFGVDFYVNETAATPITGFTGIIPGVPPDNYSPVLIGQRFDGNAGPNGTYVESANGDFAGWAVFARAATAEDVAAWVAAGPGAVPATAAARLVVNEPPAGIVQPAQADGTGTIYLSGPYYSVDGQDEPSGWEYRYVAGGVTDWLAIIPTVADHTYFIELGPFPRGIQGDLEVRWSNFPDDAVTIPNVGVGTVWGDLGDSNNVGAGTNPQVYTPSDFVGTFLAYDGGTYAANDKFGETGIYRWNDWGSNGHGGSLWPLLVNLTQSTLNEPAMVVGAPRAVADTRQMLPTYNGLSFQERTGMYQSLLNRSTFLTGTKKFHHLVLWSTPNDIAAGLSAGTFGTNLGTIATAAAADFGCQTILVKAQNTGQGGLAAFQAEVDTVAAGNADVLGVADFSDMPTPPAIHLTSSANLLTAAQRIFAVTQGPTNGILTEAGDFLVTEAGDYIVQES